MQKVRRSILPLLALIFMTAGCETSEEPAEEHDTGRFGDPYQIVTNEVPSDPDEPPALISDSLTLMVSYAGGCRDHEFTLDAELEGDSANVWLRHNDGGDDCEAQISDRIQLPIPDRVLAARTVHLLNPEADIPFVLRWDAPSLRQNATDSSESP